MYSCGILVPPIGSNECSAMKQWQEASLVSFVDCDYVIVGCDIRIMVWNEQKAELQSRWKLGTMDAKKNQILV